MRFKARLQLIGSGLTSGFLIGIFYSVLILLTIFVAQGLNRFLQFFFHLDLMSKAQLADWKGIISSFILFFVATSLVITLIIQLHELLIPQKGGR